MGAGETVVNKKKKKKSLSSTVLVQRETNKSRNTYTIKFQVVIKNRKRKSSLKRRGRWAGLGGPQ